jgi:tetratricopeptide (TPR) repeat protein
MQAMQEGQPSRAASFFEFALKKAPADPAIRILAADAYLAAEQVARAEPHVKFLLDQSDALYQRGEYELLARARAAMAKIEAARGELPGYDGAMGAGLGMLDGNLGGPSAEDRDRAQGPSITFEPAGPPVRRPAPSPEDGFAIDFSATPQPDPEPDYLQSAPPEDTGRPRVVACPWCGKTVLLDTYFSGRCQCPWYQPARGSLLHLADLQRLCHDRRAVLLMRIHQDLFALDGYDVRLRLMSRKALKVDPRLAFELDLGHAIIRPEHLQPVMPQMHPTAVFRLMENVSPEVMGTEALSGGQFYSFAELVDRIEIEYTDSLALMPRDIHYQFQLSYHLPEDLRVKADEQLATGARSYGRCLLAAGMSMEDLLRLVPGWQVLRPIGGGHGRVDAVRSLIRKGFLTEDEAIGTIAKSRGKDALQSVVDAKLISKEVADEAALELAKRHFQAPLRDDILERLCRRGEISRVALVRAGLVVGLVDSEFGGDDQGLTGAMNQIPPEEMEAEKTVLARKGALRRSERLALGKILVDLGFCSRQKLSAALAKQVTDDAPLGEILVRELAITPEQLTVALCEQEQRLEQLIFPQHAPEEPTRAVTTFLQPETAEAQPEKPKKDPESTGKKKKGGKGKKGDDGLPRWAIPAAIGGAVAVVGIGTAIYLTTRPAPPSNPYDAGLPVTPAQVPDAQDKHSEISVPWRGADGKVLAVPTGDPVALRARVTKLEVDEPGNHMGLAVLYLALGDKKSFESRIEAALRREPRNPTYMINKAFLNLEKGETRESLNLARKALGLSPDDPYAHIAMGAIWMASRNSYEADRSFARARELDPTLVVEAAPLPAAADATGGVAITRAGISLTVRAASAGIQP